MCFSGLSLVHNVPFPLCNFLLPFSTDLGKAVYQSPVPMSLYKLFFHWQTHPKLNSGIFLLIQCPFLKVERSSTVKEYSNSFHSLIYAIFLLQPSVIWWSNLVKTIQVNHTHTDEDNKHHQIYLQTCWCKDAALSFCWFVVVNACLDITKWWAC